MVLIGICALFATIGMCSVSQGLLLCLRVPLRHTETPTLSSSTCCTWRNLKWQLILCIRWPWGDELPISELRNQKHQWDPWSDWQPELQGKFSTCIAFWNNMEQPKIPTTKDSVKSLNHTCMIGWLRQTGFGTCNHTHAQVSFVTIQIVDWCRLSTVAASFCIMLRVHGKVLAYCIISRKTIK